MTGPMPYGGKTFGGSFNKRPQPKTWFDIATDIVNFLENKAKVEAAYLSGVQKPIMPFDVALTTTAVNISALGGTNNIGLFRKSHYLIVTIKDNGTANIVNLSFPNSTSSIQLTGNFAYYEWSHPEYLDLTGLQAFTDVGTATITVSGVAF